MNNPDWAFLFVVVGYALLFNGIIDFIVGERYPAILAFIGALGWMAAARFWFLSHE